MTKRQRIRQFPVGAANHVNRVGTGQQHQLVPVNLADRPIDKLLGFAAIFICGRVQWHLQIYDIRHLAQSLPILALAIPFALIRQHRRSQGHRQHLVFRMQGLGQTGDKLRISNLLRLRHTLVIEIQAGVRSRGLDQRILMFGQ